MADYIALEGGKPYGPHINRPTIEYTGKGNLLCFLGYSGRLFRSSEEAVRKDCEWFIDLYKDGEDAYLNDFFKKLNIEPTDFGAEFVFLQDNKVCPKFVFTMCGRGTNLYEKLGEPVFMIEFDIETMPTADGWNY